jgi:drug/metabolite transporter (DMT)-like permease
MITGTHKDRILVGFIIPATFVLIWSTGWIVGRFISQDSDVLTMLVLRYLCASILLALFAFISHAQWPKTRADWGHALFSGMLIHGFYLAGVWWAVGHGIPASISALLAALQPIFTAILAPRLVGEKVGLIQWAGIGLGFLGIVTVLAPKLSSVETDQLSSMTWLLIVNTGGMLSLTLGTFYQKRFLHSGDLRSVTSLQFIGAGLVTVPAALIFEDFRIGTSTSTLLSLAWSVLALSIVSIALLLFLIRRGEVARSAQLIYLVPPVASIQAFFFFGETLVPVQIAGMVLTCFGVALAMRR